MKRSIPALVLAALVAFAAPAHAKPLSGTVSTDGSTSMEKVIGSLGEAFENEHSKVKFTYNPTGSGAGIAAAKEGRCDIGLASRALKEKEKSSGLKATVLAYDGIALIVNPKNSVKNLSLADIAKIYTGEVSKSEPPVKRVVACFGRKLPQLPKGVNAQGGGLRSAGFCRRSVFLGSPEKRKAGAHPA